MNRARTTVAANLALLLIVGCRHNTSTVALPPAARKGYIQMGWIPLTTPDSKIRPGSIVQIDLAGNVSYLSHLNTCGVPDDQLKLKKGSIPPMTFKEDATYGAKAVLTLKGVDSGPDISRIAKVELKQLDQSATAMDVVALDIFLSKPGQALDPSCDKYLNQKDVYVARESYEIAKGSYTLYDKNEIKLDIPKIKIRPLIISPSANANFTTDGTLEFSQPTYTAIRRLQRVGASWKTLGSSQTSDADSVDKEVLRRLATNSGTGGGQ